MGDSTQIKISKLYQILSGKLPNKRHNYPLFDWDTMLDFFLAFYDSFCHSSMSHKDKAIASFNKYYSENVNELKKLRISKNDFEFLKTIGKGHFGEVIVVKEKNTNNVYAMKVLKKSATLSQENMAFYFEERDIMAFANSEWVTTLHYAFQDYEFLYLVMEFLPGGDLLALLNRYDDSIVDEDTCRFYLSEIIIATNCVHKIGYVHRDIKPENILIDLTGHVKLADFGSSAKLVNGTQVYGKMPVGTPEYIAPEVLTSMDSGGGKYGIPCDYWSIGVVAYEMLFGMLPFEADSVLQLYSQIMNYKNSLTFPDEDDEINPDTKDFISGLICDQNCRLTYQALAKHNFFKNMDWTTIKSMQPPFVPKVTSRTDTSNFDDISNTSSLISKNINNDMKSFSGTNVLPFVGFTFTRSLHQQLTQDIQQSHASNGSTTTISSNCKTCLKNYNENKSINEDQLSTEAVLTEFKMVSNELDNTKKDLEKSKKEMNVLQLKMSTINNDNEFYISEIEKQKNRYKELRKKFDQLAQLNQQNNYENIKLNSDFYELFELNELEYNENFKNIFIDIKKKYEELKNEKILSMKKSDELLEELKSIKSSTEILQIQNKNNEERYQTSQNELKENIKSLELMLENSKNESTEMILKLKQTSIKDCEIIENLKEKISKLELKLIEKRKEPEIEIVDNLKSHLNTANTSLDMLKNENNELNNKVINLIQNENKYKKQIIEFENKIEKFTTEKHDFELNCIKNKQTILDKNLLISNLNEKVLTLEKSKMNLNCCIEISNNKLNKKDDIIKELENKIKNYESQIKNEKNNTDNQLLINKLKVAELKIDSLTCELEDRKTSDKFNLQSLKTSQQNVKELNETIDKIEKLTNIYQSENKQLIETIQAQKTSNYALTELIEKLKDDLLNSNQEIISITNEFDKHKNTSRENEFRLSETVKQQEKLILFLQSMDVKTKKTLKSYKKDSNFQSLDYSHSKKSLHKKMTIKGNMNKSIISDLERDAILRSIGKIQNDFRNSKSSLKSEEKTTLSNKSSEHAPKLNSNNQSIKELSNSKINIENKKIDENLKNSKISLKSKDSKNDKFSKELKKSEIKSNDKINKSDNVKSSDNILIKNKQNSIDKNIIENVFNSSSQSQSQLHINKNETENLSCNNDENIIKSRKKVYLKDKTKSFSSQTTFDYETSECILNDINDYSVHTFVEKFNMYLNVCMICYTPMQFGINIFQCDKCLMKCHIECIDYVFYRCGFKIYAWNPYIPTIKFCSDYFSIKKSFNIPAMGWVNTLVKIIKTKTEWEQRWMVLTNTELMFFKTEKTIEEINEMNENIINDRIEVYKITPHEYNTSLCISSSDTMLFAGTTDSKNFWNIQIPSKYTTVVKKKQDDRSFLYFSSSSQDKIYWVSLLSEIFNQQNLLETKNYKNALTIETIETIQTQTIYHINCILKINLEISLVAAGKYLYLFSQQSFAKKNHFIQLNGFEFISGMTIIKDTIFMIYGKSRNLLKIDSKILLNELKVKKPTKFDIQKFIFSGYHKKCHYIHAGKLDKEKYLAVAIGHRLLIFKLPNSTPLIDLKLDAMIGKLIFTSGGLLYQTNLISHLNIKSGECKIFLNQNDNTLTHYIFAQKNQCNYLINVLPINNKKSFEYILCYSEVGLFVNEKGTRSRPTDLVWSGIPLSFEIIRNDLLCICYYNSIEIYKLDGLCNPDIDINKKYTYPILSPSITHYTMTDLYVIGSSKTAQSYHLYKLTLPS